MKNLEITSRHGFAEVEGIKLHYVEAGWNNARSIILLHGFPDFWYSWRHQVPYLAKDYHVIAVDQRGYNLSGKPRRVSDYSVDLLVNDVKNIAKSLGLTKFTLVGHDWGGAISWEFANQHPKMLTSLIILNCPPIQVLMAENLRNGLQMKSSYYIYLFQIPKLPELVLGKNEGEALARLMVHVNKAITPAELLTYRKGLSTPGTLKSGINYYRCAIRQFFPEFLGGTTKKIEIHVPVLVIWGVKDEALQESLTRSFPALCKRDFTIKRVEAGHFVHQERPLLVNRLIARYLEKYPP